MSTRATILVKGSNKEKYVYHHHDGYPEGVGYDLKTFLERYKDVDNWDFDKIYGQIVSDEIDNEYEPTTCIHGDSEYVYVIDTDNKTLKGYEHDWDEGLSCIKPENEVEIK